MIKIKRDPIEKTKLFKSVELTANVKARNRVIEFIQRWEDFGMQIPDRMGNLYGYDRFCFEKKRILMEDYGIAWMSPTELNPGIDFDEMVREYDEEE